MDVSPSSLPVVSLLLSTDAWLGALLLRPADSLPSLVAPEEGLLACLLEWPDRRVLLGRELCFEDFLELAAEVKLLPVWVPMSRRVS